MKIDFIRVINFKQYLGEQKAEISTSQDLNVTVFHGINGTGKTSLFLALNWCLYNTGIEKSGFVLNKEAFHDAEEGSVIPLVVTVCFRDSNQYYTAERFIKFKKKDGQPSIEEQGFWISKNDSSGNSEYLPNPTLVMDTILPENVREYFFFDGEKMEDLTRPDNKKIEEAIKNIMRLPIIDSTEKHISNVFTEFRRELGRKGTIQLEELIREEEQLEQKIVEKKNAREKKIDDIRLGKSQIQDLERSLRSNEKSQKLQEKRDMLEERRKELEELSGNLTESIRANSTCLYTKYLVDVGRIALTIADEKREKGQIPSGIKEQFIHDLLDKDICICGRKISEDEFSREHIKAYLKKSTPNTLENLVLNIPGVVKLISFHANDTQKDLEVSCKQKAEIEQNIEDISKRIDEIKHELGSSPDVDISNLQKNLSNFQHTQQMNQNALLRLEFEIEDLSKKISDVIKNREIEEKKQGELTLLSKKEELARRSAEAIIKIKDEFYNKARDQIQKETQQVFSELAWKQDHFQDIQLNQDFHLEVIDKWGSPSREELSAGERQILSLSFIAAMARLSGEEAPIIMDTPFGRLSGTHLEKVASIFPNLVPQLILLVTDREWEGTDKTTLRSRIGYQYLLNFDGKSGCTKIEEVEDE